MNTNYKSTRKTHVLICLSSNCWVIAMWANFRMFWIILIYYTAHNTEETTADAYTLVNAFVRYETQDIAWSIELYGKNLADEEYYTRLTNGSFMTLPFHNPVVMTNADAGLPRTFGFRVGYSF